MQSFLGVLAISAASFLVLSPVKALAQIPERHQELIQLSLQEITFEGNKTAYDNDIMGQIFFRCSILYSIMESVVVAATPEGSSDSVRAKVEQAKENFHNRSELMMMSGVRIIELSEDQVFDIFKEMHSVWSDEFIYGAAQMFLKNEEGSPKDIIGQHFKQQLDLCNSTSSDLIKNLAKALQ